MARKQVAGSGYGNVFIDSLIWGGAAWDQNVPIKVYAGNSDEIYDAWTPDDSGYITEDNIDTVADWNDNEYSAFIYALNVYSSVCGLKFEFAANGADADIVWWKVDLGEGLLGIHETPTNPNDQIWGYFNSYADSWSNLHFGGDALNTVIHELGHAFGLAHPHDGGSEPDGTTFPGIWADAEGASQNLGDYGYNQSVNTVMSYVRGSTTAPSTLEYGGQAGLGAFDIAALQVLYGPNNATATGNDVYTLPTFGDVGQGAGWQCIWDAGGDDTISAGATSGTVYIDLTAATLVYGDPGAGGYVSQQDGFPGGYTIANGVTIENAIGGSGDDELIGNVTANQLIGSGGSDILWGDYGNDILRGGAGRDIFVFDTRPNKVSNKDRILDYSTASDTIWLDNSAFTKLGRGSYEKPTKLKSDMFIKASRPHDREDRIIYNSKKGVLYYDADGTGSKYKMVEIAILKKGLAMTQNEFFVV